MGSSTQSTTPTGKKAHAIRIIDNDTSPDSVASVQAQTPTSLTPSLLSQPSQPSPIVNPYKKTMKRPLNPYNKSNASKKRKGKPIKRPGDAERANDAELLPTNMNPMERFFGALLRSSPADFAQSTLNSGEARKLWEAICRRVGLSVPTTKLPLTYTSLPEYQRPRAALVLEEARHALATAPKRKGFLVQIHTVEPAGNLHYRLACKGLTKFSSDQLKELRPGSVFSLKDTEEVWGVVLKGNRDRIIKRNMFELLVCTNVVTEQSVWTVCSLCSLVTDYRCFEAVTSELVSPFLPTLFNGSPVTEGSAPAANSVSRYKLRLPALNLSQEDAAKAFLDSKTGSLTVVQGPPGTGKTTLLVSTIGQYVQKQDSTHSRVLVCAPTNKAISVLTDRFLRALEQVSSEPPLVLLVGDSDKLLPGRDSCDHPFASVFLYTWMPRIQRDYMWLTTNPDRKEAIRLRDELKRRLLNVPKTVVHVASEIANLIERKKPYSAQLSKLLVMLKSFPMDQVYRDLMLSAEVIFCTLSCSGSTSFANTRKMHDLIIDEAAAATEAELCIPFQTSPSRLLVVGDPKQLPATVLSSSVIELGFDTSLHQRLMCVGMKPKLLNIQYRMDPSISQFPSFRFYDNKVLNGPNVLSYSGRAPLLDRKPYKYIQVKGAEETGHNGSYRNAAEAKAIVDLVGQLKRPGNGWNSADKLRIITFYQAQVGLIQSLLRKHNLGNVTVATVDSSQGCEADVVLVSMVRSPSAGRNRFSRHDAGFLTDDRRMNVALTRARHQLICVANIAAFQDMKGADTLQMLAKDAASRDVIVTSASSGTRSRAFGREDNLVLFYGD